MKVKNVVDIFGRKFTVDEEKRKIHSYNNEKKEINYTTPEVVDGKETMFFIEYVEEGTVDSIEARLNTWNNKVAAVYAARVDFDADKNDPDGKIWAQYVEEVKNNPDKYFTKKGDWKKHTVVTFEPDELYRNK